ncbi:MAG: hypothetical protein Q9196_001775 [Gyalolechia fulgens]
MASICTLIFLLCNVFAARIVASFATAISPARLLRRVEPNRIASPFGDPPFGIPPVPVPIPDWTEDLPHSPGTDQYNLYTGNGSIAAGWPHKADWMSYDRMFTANIPLLSKSCSLYHVSPNNPYEIASIHNATLIIALETNTDPRFILAIIMQESGGCVRVPTSYYSTRNPGLMQSHNGPATCNEDATPQNPCPYVTIEEMIREGTAGAGVGNDAMGLVEALRKAEGGADDVARYYRAARVYNSGSVDPSGDLGKGVATHCYASDIANRLRGWVMSEDGCAEWKRGGWFSYGKDGAATAAWGRSGRERGGPA